jgi:dihydrodipicolinate synthase/N-acetylneuraminate lyase
MMHENEPFERILKRGVAIPASPLALDRNLRLDERRQRGLWRYYSASGAGGIAVGVHTTQFEIRDSKVGLFEPILRLAAEEFDRLDRRREEPLVRIAGVCGQTAQAIAEATLARELGFHAGLLSLSALREADDETLLAHCRTVAEAIPIVGFYLQAAVGGRLLSHGFWRRFAEIERVVAIKVAPFNRYQTLDVVRAVAESGRDDLALYTGNDDNIVLDLITPFAIRVDGRTVVRRFVGGLLGHWAAWTSKAVACLRRCQTAATGSQDLQDLLRLGAEVTDANSALFDAANGFAGCIAGIHEVLRRQGLLEGTWCLDPKETLSPGQAAEIDRIYRQYPHLTDDAFVAAHRDQWLA